MYIHEKANTIKEKAKWLHHSEWLPLYAWIPISNKDDKLELIAVG